MRKSYFHLLEAKKPAAGKRNVGISLLKRGLLSMMLLFLTISFGMHKYQDLNKSGDLVRHENMTFKIYHF